MAMVRKRMNIRDKTVSIFMAVLFMASIFITGIKLITPTPINIVVEGSDVVVSQMPGFYTLADMIIVTVSALLLGISAIYLLFVDVKPVLEKKSERVSSVKNAANSSHDKKQIPGIMDQNKIEEILGVLKGSEPKIIKTLLDFGEMNQAELVVRTGIPKSSLSRILADLERRGLVIRYDFGTSKMIKLGDKFVNRPTSTG
ncbi:MAG: helix-turn-helix domain-containing protein [Halobacteriota archaeon]